MADKREILHNLKAVQHVKTWQLVILLILMGFMAATFLRLNNIGMVERRTAVVSADNKGTDDVTRNRLYDLQRFVTSHMNTDMGKGIYLESGYKRAVEAAYATASIRDNIYKEAQNVCAPKFTSYSYAYLQCTLNELQKHPSAPKLELPAADAYLHVYISPLWTPDFAGWSLAISVVILIMIIGRVTSVIILRLMLRRHYKTI